MKIAIVGATGNVGRKIIEVLEQKKLLVHSTFTASTRSRGFTFTSFKKECR